MTVVKRATHATTLATAIVVVYDKISARNGSISKIDKVIIACTHTPLPHRRCNGLNAMRERILSVTGTPPVGTTDRVGWKEIRPKRCTMVVAVMISQ